MGRFKERRREIKKTPLKDRPGWQKFKSMLPGLASGIASIVPGGKIISTIIDGLVVDQDVTEEQKITALEFLQPVEQEEQIIDTEDMQNAREAELARMESPDWLVRNIIPVIAIAWTGFTMSLYILVLTHRLDATENIAFLIINSVSNTAFLITGYYFGSTNGSKDKDKTIQRMSTPAK